MRHGNDNEVKDATPIWRLLCSGSPPWRSSGPRKPLHLRRALRLARRPLCRFLNIYKDTLQIYVHETNGRSPRGRVAYCIILQSNTLVVQGLKPIFFGNTFGSSSFYRASIKYYHDFICFAFLISASRQ